MIYQCANGRSIEISFEQFDAMSDAELNALEAYPMGENIEDPWFGSVLSKLPPPDVELDEPIIEDLTNISFEEKLTDPDLDISLEEE